MKDELKLTLDTQCVIYLFDTGTDKPPHFDSLQELMNLSFSGKLVIAITTRAELDLGRDPVPFRKATLFEKLGIFPVVGTSPLPIQSVEGECVPDSDHAQIWAELRRIIFPGLQREDRRFANKAADIGHLVGHLINRRDVFVTNDSVLLKKAAALKSAMNLLVLDPTECLDFVKKEVSERLRRRIDLGPVTKYAANVVHIGGIGSRVVTKTAWLMTEHGYLNSDEYVIVGYNNGGDLMSLSAKEGYKIVDSQSSTGNEILSEPSDKFKRIRLEDKMRNEFTIFCEAR